MPRSPRSDNSGEDIAEESFESDEQEKMKLASDGASPPTPQPRQSSQPMPSLQLFRSESNNKRALGTDPRAYKSQSLEVLTELISIDTADANQVSGFDPRRWIVAAGLLEKRRDGRMREGWAKRFFVLGKTALYYYLLPKSDAAGYAPLLGDERGCIKLTDIQEVTAHARDHLYWYVTVTVGEVRKNSAAQYFSDRVSQLQLRTPAETGQLWLDAIIKARDDARKMLGSPGRSVSGKKSMMWGSDGNSLSAPPLLTSQASSVVGDDVPKTPAAGNAPVNSLASPTAAGGAPPSLGNGHAQIHPRPRRDSSKIRALDLIPLDQSFPLANSVPISPFLLGFLGLFILAYPSKVGAGPYLPEWTTVVPGNVYFGCGVFLALIYYEMSRRVGHHDAVAREAKFRAGVMRDEVNKLKDEFLVDGEEDHKVLLPATQSEIQRVSEACIGVDHVAGSSTKYTLESMRPGIDYMCWNNARGADFKLRIGPNYKKNSLKAPSEDPLYTLVALDMLRSKERICNIAGGCSERIELPAYRPDVDPSMEDIRKSGLPRLFIVNAQIPEKAPAMFGKQPEDAGYSIVFYFVIKPETVVKALSATPSPSIKLLKRFVKEHATNPDIRRRFKAIGIAENAKDLGIKVPMVMSLIDKFNGKPVIINKVAQVYECEENDPTDWFEIDISIYDFPYVAKSTLASIKDRVSEILLRAGFVIQGEGDEELPECLLGGADMCGLDFRLAKVI